MSSKSSSKPPSRDAHELGGQMTGALAVAEEVISELRARKLHLTTVESCTGGAVADILTSVPGAGDVLEDAFITYSNEAKIELGVPAETIDQFTVYSAETALAMAQTGRQRSLKAEVAVGITGSLSRVDPANADASTPGEVYLGLIFKDREIIRRLQVPEPYRPAAKLYVVKQALDEIKRLISPVNS